MRRISKETWEQIKTAYASGIGLRELARNMNLPSGTVLARAKREGRTKQIQTVKQQALPVQSTAITPMQSAALTMQQSAERHVYRMAGVTDKVLPHLESMQPKSGLDRIDEVEKYDRLARRNYGLADNQGRPSTLNVEVLTQGRSIIRLGQPPNETPERG